MRRNYLSCLTNELRIKKWHFQEQPDTIVKCYSDKFGRKHPILEKMTMAIKQRRKNTDNLLRSAPSIDLYQE